MNHPTNLFYGLTPDLILSAIESLGLEPTGRYIPLNSIENRVYDIELSDSSRIVVKFYRPGRWTKEQIIEEHEFIEELAQGEIPVLTPISIGGKTIFESEGIYFAIWPLRNGRIVEELGDLELERVGAMLGRIHSIGKRKQSNHRISLDVVSYGKRSLDFILDGGWIQNSHISKRYSESALRAFQTYETALKKYNIPFQRIHGDCHKGNLLIGTEGFSILDFDDFMMGPAIQDFWMILPPNFEQNVSAWESFIGGYQTFAEFDRNWLELIEPLRAIRYVYYAAWIAKRWEDPSFPMVFPHFGTEEYWLKETQDLENKEREFEPNESNDLNPNSTGDGEKELTNEDFFWDWEK